MSLLLARFTYLGVALACVIAPIVAALLGRRRGLFRVGGLAVALTGVLPLIYVGLVYAGLLTDRYLRFHEPIALSLAALFGAVLGWRLSQLPVRMGPFRRGLVVALSWGAVFLAVLAVARPDIGKRLDRLAVVIAVDRSRSVDLVPGADARVRAELTLAEKGMRKDDRIAIVAFGAQAATEDPLRPRSELPAAQRAEVGRDGTDVEAGLRRALAELPPDYAGRIVLVSDGVQTRGDALAAAAAAMAADVPIDVVVLEQRAAADVRVVGVRAPTHADEGEPLDLRVVTSSSVETEVEVRVKRDGELLHQGKAKIAKGEDVLRIRELAPASGLHRYDVEITAIDPAVDGSPEDNSGSAFVKVRGPSLALVLEGDAGKGAPLARALEASGFRVEQRSTNGVPSDLGGLAGFDLVVLSDVRASDLADTQIDALASYARDLGGGLLLMGGDRSLGPGGYARTPIEEVSPVSFDLKQQKRRASLAEVIAIDFSGSMGMSVGGHTKLELANEAAARSASLLGEGDRLAVEHVDTSVHWTVPMAPVTDPARLGASIRAVQVGGGGIFTDIALQAAYASLAKEQVNLKHVLLFADGGDAEQIAGCRAYVKGAFERGITTSVISLGRGSDTPELEVLSKVGGGRFYLIEDATKLPAVFTQETILAAKSAIHEDPFRASVGAPGAPTRSVDFSRQPELKGYVVTVPKPRATVLLGGPEGDPLLATWAVGVGHVAAFTSDYKDRWGAAWLGWGDAAKMFGQLARDTARKSDDPRVRLESDAAGGELHVRADVVGDDGRAQSFRRLTAHVAGPDGFSREVALEAVGAGRYAASVPLSRPGTYVAVAKDEATGEAVGTSGAVLTAGEELRPTGSDRALLRRIATTTNGKTRPTLEGLFDDRAAKRFAYTPLATPLVLLSGLAMLFAVASRRLGVPSIFEQMAQRVRSWRADEAARKAQRAVDEARIAQLAMMEQQRLNEVLRARRGEMKGGAPGWGGTWGTRAPTTTSSTTPTTTATATTSATPTTTTIPNGNPVAPPGIHPGMAAERPLTAAERLAMKRRERRS